MSPRPYRLGQRDAAVAQTRERILAAARALFAESGFHSVSLEEVARRADVSRKTVYYQFDSKAGLLEAVVISLEQRFEIVDRVRALVEQGDALQALPDYFLEVCRFWASAAEVMSVLHGQAALDRDVAEVLNARDAARRDRLVGFVDRLAAQQGITSSRDRSEIVDTLWMLTSFTTFDHLARRSERTPEQVAAILTELIEGLLESRRASDG